MSMSIYVLIAIFLSIVGVFSLKYCNSLHTLETICLFLFSSIIIVQTSNIGAFCFKLFNITSTHLAVLAFYVQFGILIPCLVVLLFNALYSRTSVPIKVCLCAANCACVTGIFICNVFTHVLALPSSMLLPVIILYIAILMAVGLFAVTFRQLLRRELST